MAKVKQEVAIRFEGGCNHIGGIDLKIRRG